MKSTIQVLIALLSLAGLCHAGPLQERDVLEKRACIADNCLRAVTQHVGAQTDCNADFGTIFTTTVTGTFKPSPV
jgi:hypothetical protein